MAFDSAHLGPASGTNLLQGLAATSLGAVHESAQPRPLDGSHQTRRARIPVLQRCVVNVMQLSSVDIHARTGQVYSAALGGQPPLNPTTGEPTTGEPTPFACGRNPLRRMSTVWIPQNRLLAPAATPWGSAATRFAYGIIAILLLAPHAAGIDIYFTLGNRTCGLAVYSWTGGEPLPFTSWLPILIFGGLVIHLLIYIVLLLNKRCDVVTRNLSSSLFCLLTAFVILQLFFIANVATRSKLDDGSVSQDSFWACDAELLSACVLLTVAWITVDLLVGAWIVIKCTPCIHILLRRRFP